jgi:NAD(P)H-nitrite reductase large subunit
MHGHHVEDELCVCFHVARAKVIRWVKRERPRVVSQISECLSAGTGCGWCIPFLSKIHEDVMAGREPEPQMSREEYLLRREEYRRRVAAHEALPNSLRPTAEQAPQSSVGSADDPA